VPVIWRNIPFWYRDYLSLGAAGLGRRLGRKLRRVGLGRPAGRSPGGPDELVDADLSALPEHHFELLRAQVAALRKYRPRPFGGTIHLFTARGWTVSRALFGSLDPYHGWGQLAAGGVELHPVEGGHRNLHLQPHVASLAAALGEVLGEVLAAGPQRRAT
jgi:hypothetical protein